MIGTFAWGEISADARREQRRRPLLPATVTSRLSGVGMGTYVGVHVSAISR